MLKLAACTCEGCVDPLGVGHPEKGRPLRFAWRFAAQSRGIQTAWRIAVRDGANGEQVWDSGRVGSPSVGPIAYGGPPLSSRRRYAWRLTVWDDSRAGDPSGPGAVNEPPADTAEGVFETGLLRREDWSARWIRGFPQLRRDFVLPAEAIRARAYVTAVGYYELYLNGRKVGDHLLDPSHTEYRRRVEYSTFDVATFLRQGENAAGLLLGHGFPAIAPWFEPEPLGLVQIEIETSDGRFITIGSDEHWTGTGNGPIRADSLYDGEVYDAGFEIEGWAEPRCAGEWLPCVVAEDPGGVRVPRLQEPIRVLESWRPVSVTALADGSSVVDAGRYLTGWLRLECRGPAGSTVTLRYAEVLHEDGSVNQESNMTAACTDSYTLRGGGTESWEPRFTYHGFRYVQVTGFPGQLSPDQILCRFVASDLPATSRFGSSNALLDRIHGMFVHTCRCNQFGIPTDSANRSERRGWLTSGVLPFEFRARSFDSGRFHRKWLDDMLDVWDPATGRMLANQAPAWGKSKGLNPRWMGAIVLVPFRMYLLFDDRESLRLAWPAARSWLEDVWGQCRDALYLGPEEGNPDFVTFAGDWLGIDSPHWQQFANAYLIEAMDAGAKSAQILGDNGAADVLRSRAAAMRRAYHERFYASPPPDFEFKTASVGWYGSFNSVTQCGQMLPLLFDIVPADDRAGVAANLYADLCESRGEPQFTTGISTVDLFELLVKERRNDIAYRLFTRTGYPGYGFMLSKGATACWERWKYYTGKEMNCHCHVELMGAGAWIARGLAGITSAGDAAAGRLFRVEPWFEEELDHMEYAESTQWGTIALAWRRRGRSLHLTLDIPANTVAEVSLRLPRGTRFAARAGRGDPLGLPAGTLDSLVLPRVLPGRYEITVRRVGGDGGGA